MAIGLNNVSGIQYLIPAKKQRIYTKSVIIGALANFIMNWILIPKFKAGGAIVSSVIAEFLILFVQLIEDKNDLNIAIVIKNSWKYIISSLVMFAPTYAIGKYMNSTIYTTLVQIVVAVIIYGSMLVILKDNFVIRIIEQIKNKIYKSLDF